MSKGNMRRLETIKEKKKKEEKKEEDKLTFFWRILAVIGRCGPHLMTVMIFVIKKTNF